MLLSGIFMDKNATKQYKGIVRILKWQRWIRIQ